MALHVGQEVCSSIQGVILTFAKPLRKLCAGLHGVLHSPFTQKRSRLLRARFPELPFWEKGLEHTSQFTLHIYCVCVIAHADER